MSSTAPALKNNTSDAASRKEQPLWAVPAVLAILMISSGVFFVLIAHGISILSSVGY